MTTRKRVYAAAPKATAASNGKDKVETFVLGERVKTTNRPQPMYGSGVNGTGVIVGIQFQNLVPNGNMIYQVRESSGTVYSYLPTSLDKLKTQTLYAYTDATEEVHWATKKYSDKEMTEFGFTRSTSYDKTIDLE